MDDEPATPACVVWSPQGTIDAQLLDALRRRRVEAVVAAGPHEALARLLALNASGRSVALLLAEPDRLARPGRLLAAAERAVEPCICWWYQHRHGEPHLAAATAADCARWAADNNPSPVVVLPRPASENRAGANVRPGGAYGAPGAVDPPQTPPHHPTAHLRLSGEGPAAETASDGGGSPRDEERMDPPPAGSVLTEEELSMLLADDEPEPRTAEEPTGR